MINTSLDLVPQGKSIFPEHTVHNWVLHDRAEGGHLDLDMAKSQSSMAPRTTYLNPLFVSTFTKK